MRPIKDLRQSKGVSRNDLAEFLGISLSSLGYYERGERIPDAETLKRLADYFEVSTDYLLYRSPFPNDTDKAEAEQRAKDITVLLTDLAPEARSLFIPALDEFLSSLGGAVPDSSSALISSLAAIIKSYTNVKRVYSERVIDGREMAISEYDTDAFILGNGLLNDSVKAALAEMRDTARTQTENLSAELLSMFERDLEREIKAARLNVQGDKTPRRNEEVQEA